MFEQSFTLIKAFVFPYQKHLRFFFIGCALFVMCIYFLIGIPFFLFWILALLFVILAFIVNQISHFTLKEIGSFRVMDKTYFTEINGKEKQFHWHDVADVNLERINGTIYRLKLNRQIFLLEMEVDELMSLEDLLESKDLMEKSRWSFYVR